ncbi:MAG: ABC transporter ATP-binding protein/permease [Anaerolineae bacterium]|nr:ABC transporter ATP-binding protein/permease [Anaerolineae bacterium]
MHLGQYKKYVVLIPFLVFLDVLSELSIPLLMSRIVDVGIVNSDIGYIARIGLYMVLLACAAIFFGVLNMKYTSLASQGFGANLREALFSRVQEFSFNNIDRFSTASLVTRLTNDVNNLQFTFMMVLRMLLRAPMMLIIAFFLAFSINARLSIILAIAIPLLSVSVWLILSRAVKLFTPVQQKIDNLNRIVQENLIGIRVVKSFVREDHEKEKFREANDDYTQTAINAISLAILNMPVMMLVMNGATLAIIWFGGNMVYFGDLGAGELVSFISYVMQILFSVMMISMIFLLSARAQASGERVVEVLDTNIDIRDSDQPKVSMAGNASENKTGKGKVEFRNVSFKYNQSGSGEDVLTNISFAAKPGEVVAIIGGTGTGKSTLVNLIPRLYDVTEGAVLVDDVDVRDYELEKLRDLTGVVLQKNTLFSGSIRENILWGNHDASQEEIETACRDAQAYDFISSFPNGFDTELGQGGVNLSGGQKQRLCIARAMLKKPAILILDDSTSAVDTATEAKIRESFYRNLADTTVFIIAQRISSVRDADTIIVLDDGKISGMGTHQQLLESNEIYKEINLSQQEGVLVNE